MADERVTVLLIEGDRGDVELLGRGLTEAWGDVFDLQHAGRLADGVQRLGVGDVDVVLLGLSLPDGAGLDVFLAARRAAPDVPIVVLTGFDDEGAATKALRAGAQDYLVRGQLDARALARPLRYAIERLRTRRDLQHLPIFDEPTGLYNAEGFGSMAEHYLAFSRRTERPLALVLMLVNELDAVNETLGHRSGARLIADAADCLQKSVRRNDVVGRIDGAQFCVLITDDALPAAEAVRRRLQASAAKLNVEDRREYRISLSIGVAVSDPQGPATLDELLALARTEMREHEGKQRPDLRAV